MKLVWSKGVSHSPHLAWGWDISEPRGESRRIPCWQSSSGSAASWLCFCLTDLFCCLFLIGFHSRIDRHFCWRQAPASPFTEEFNFLCAVWNTAVQHSSFKSPPVLKWRAMSTWLPSLHLSTPRLLIACKWIDMISEGCFCTFPTLFGQSH